MPSYAYVGLSPPVIFHLIYLLVAFWCGLPFFWFTDKKLNLHLCLDVLAKKKWVNLKDTFLQNNRTYKTRMASGAPASDVPTWKWWRYFDWYRDSTRQYEWAINHDFINKYCDCWLQDNFYGENLYLLRQVCHIIYHLLSCLTFCKNILKRCEYNLAS